MINKNWLVVSLFIPLWGAIINLIIVMRNFNKRFNPNKEYSTSSKKFFSWCGVLGGAFGGSMILIALINGIVTKATGLTFDYILYIAVIVSGYIANIVFYIYYRKRIEPTFNGNADDNYDKEIK